MYAIVTKVTTPPRTSVPTVEPRRVISKNLSKAFFGSGGSVFSGAAGAFDAADAAVLMGVDLRPETLVLRARS
ncbi:hypothetical protein GCM10025760_26410 [Microbacterium yannicii]|uniref:Uncharacterized protein n=1 Tax=Microbacterium yannicii TaxID=671622 RepID=A0ABP9MGQ3_9MICO